ncbi:MAG: DUF4145 domain-containing protein [Candidatus Pacebacteria bacterium]|nr:DUF4145 domain-containing protein [Candidatus Paceibacterota bacterium]
MSYAWTCPFCKLPTTIVSTNETAERVDCTIPSKKGKLGLIVNYIICPNTECNQLTLIASLYTLKQKPNAYGYATNELLNEWNLIPDSSAKVFSPDIVPQVIINDYEEACKIMNLSPKASATLSRRALQGMIRHFWGIKKPEDHKGKWTLWNEIQAIKSKPDLGLGVWSAIDAVRKVGNIGAHMEEDINLIIDVEPEEASKLIWLIEFLIEKWYIQKYETDLQLAEIIGMANAKTTKK